MSDSKRVICTACGGLAWWHPVGGLPVDRVTCRSCRWERYRQERDAKPHEASVASYKRGCRCPDCRTANSIDCGNRKGRKAIDRPCGICGAVFSSRIPHARYCSEECKKAFRRMHSSQYRALKGASSSEDERVVAHEIFERDSWRCHICRRKLSSRHLWPHPRSATMDHLVPVSLGGEHKRTNIKTACLFCNISKGNRGGNEQLLLIG